MRHSRRSKVHSDVLLTTLSVMAVFVFVAEVAHATDCIGASPDELRSTPERTASPHAGLVWEWSDHRAWFTRFWSGDCAAQLEGCREWVPFAGARHWQAVMARTLDRAAPADRPRLRCRLFDLGRRIGHEWSRESQVRAVDTARLETWSKELQAANGSAQIDQAIDRLQGALARARGGD